MIVVTRIEERVLINIFIRIIIDAMKTFHKTIIFSKIPIAGYFRYKDIFQIYPANLHGMPTTTVFQKHYPIILEYWTTEAEKINFPSDYDELKDLYSLTATTLTKQDIILSLLTSITNHVFFRYTDQIGRWGMPILKEDAGEEANTWSSKWCLPHFHWPTLPEQLKIVAFSNTGLPEINFVSHLQYYLHNPNFDYYFDKTIEFPDTIYKVLDSYFSQPKDQLEIINSSISFATSAMELRSSKKTLSVISAFTAIETMVNLEYKNAKPEKCESCGQLKYEVSKKYRDFLFKYIGESENNKKKFNAYYSLRSKIIHSGQRLKTEKLFSNVSDEEKDKEFLTEIEILQLAKLSVINWLIENKQEL